jgi:hypothetical protein
MRIGEMRLSNMGGEMGWVIMGIGEMGLGRIGEMGLGIYGS